MDEIIVLTRCRCDDVREIHWLIDGDVGNAYFRRHINDLIGNGDTIFICDAPPPAGFMTLYLTELERLKNVPR